MDMIRRHRSHVNGRRLKPRPQQRRLDRLLRRLTRERANAGSQGERRISLGQQRQGLPHEGAGRAPGQGGLHRRLQGAEFRPRIAQGRRFEARAGTWSERAVKAPHRAA